MKTSTFFKKYNLADPNLQYYLRKLWNNDYLSQPDRINILSLLFKLDAIERHREVSVVVPEELLLNDD
jgi:hypothetical protein